MLNRCFIRRIPCVVFLGVIFMPACDVFGVADRFEPDVDPAMGFNMVSWANFGNQGADVWTTAVQEVHDAGFSEVSLSPVRFVTPGTGAIATTSSRGPELSHLEAAIVRAKALDMRVTLNPFVEPENFAFWRGQYNPTPGSGESNTFWSDYQQYILDVAQLAETHDVEALTVGTELRAIVRNNGNNAQWASLIDAVDGVYGGEIGYAANWDNFKNNNLTSAIWEHPAIDFIGIDAYFRIVSNAQADASGVYPDANFLNLLTNQWTSQLVDDIIPFADARKGGTGMDLVFTEYGVAPFNRGVTQQPTSVVDQDEQRMAFEGLLRALDGRVDDVGALHIWQWGMPGAAGSQFYMDPDLQSNIAGGFDESLNTATTNWLSQFVSNPLSPDFNQDGVIDGGDIDLLMDQLVNGPADPATFDLNGDGAVSLLDRTEWLERAGAQNLASGGAYLLGDANLDGVVDGQDFITWNQHKFSAATEWTKGNFT
ncbi:MAG: glycoside hydrolase TIM-barrel-like domain-containing protein, partial [Planctomycetota bacterium]